MKFILIFIVLILWICAADYVQFDVLGTYNEQTYYVPTGFTAGWTQASSTCQENGYKLASFETIEELNAVQDMCRKNIDWFGPCVHVDGIRNDSQWILTVSNKRINYTIPWAPGEPNNLNGVENYLCLMKGQNFLVNDVLDNYPYKFICEF